MTEPRKKNKNILFERTALICFVMMGLALLIGCSGKFGSLKRDQEVQQLFESSRLPLEYKYYYDGYSSYPYVIFGIAPQYEMNSKMWREAAPDTEDFAKMVKTVWEDYGYYKFGADILDPNGKKVGILYSAIYETSIKFVGDNQIVVMPNSPFLWGPGGDDQAP